MGTYIDYKSMISGLKTWFFTGSAAGAVAFERNVVGTCGLRRIVEKILAHQMHSFKRNPHRVLYLLHACFAKICLRPSRRPI